MSSSGGLRRSWTTKEDEDLRLQVRLYGDQCGKNGSWDKISAKFQHRSAKDCRKRWFHSLDPKLKRGRWSEAEDKTLIEAYNRLGPSWQRVAQLIPGRTDDQCSKRYNDVLAPGASDRLREWTKEEDDLLIQLVDQMGTCWRDICKEFDGRTGLTCRNRWRKLKSRLELEAGAGTQSDLGKLQQPPLGEDPQEFPDPPYYGREQVPSFEPAERGGPPAPHYTISYEPEASYQHTSQPSSQQHPIAEQELERILEFCRANNQKIVIHQHIYQASPPPVPQPPQQQPAPAALPLNLSAPQRFLDTPQPEDVFIGLGNFANMDYLAFNPS